MTLRTIEMANHFVNGTMSAEGLAADRASSDIFMLADCYNPHADREAYELDENQLREEIKQTLEKLKHESASKSQ